MITKEKAIEILRKKDSKNYNLVNELLEEASNKYYNTDEVILTDGEYDSIYNLYKELSGNAIIGALPEGKGTINVAHSYQNLVGTLDKLFTFEEAEEWLKEIFNKFGNDFSFDDILMRVSLKYDGNSVTLEYDKNGNVLKALTRGRGGKGKDLTHVFKNRKLKANMDCDFAIKYEAIISYENYDKICELYDQEYANPRSLISGILGSDDAYKYEKYITLIPLKIKFSQPIKNLLEEGEYEDYFFKNIFGNDVPYLKYSIHVSGNEVEDFISELRKFYEKINNERTSLPFMIDGLVIDILNTSIHNELGYTPDGSIPKFSKALKFPYLEKRSTVISIDFSFGNSGRITPVVYFNEVDFNGTKHIKQSLSNYKRFEELKLGIGSEILVSYHSDCLTYITGINNEHNAEITPIEFIDHCPICGGDLLLNENETFCTCMNPNCSGKLIGKLENYFTKMDIKGIKAATLEKLVDKGLVHSIQDMYELDYNKVSKIEGLGVKSADIIRTAIDNKIMYDYEILGSMLIQNFSIESAKILCRTYTIYEILKMYQNSNIEDFVNCIKEIEGFSDITARYLYEGIEENYDTIDYLIKYRHNNIRIYKEEIEANSTGEESLTIVFTGVRDKNLEKALEMKGHRITSSVSNKTDILICLDPSSNSTKAKKARELGKEVISYEKAKNRWLN